MRSSRHETAIYQVLKRGEWLTSKQIAAETGISGRTVRHHLLRFVRFGIAEVTAFYPGHRYRLAAKLPRLEAASQVLSGPPGKREDQSIRDAWSQR